MQKTEIAKWQCTRLRLLCVEWTTDHNRRAHHPCSTTINRSINAEKRQSLSLSFCCTPTAKFQRAR